MWHSRAGHLFGSSQLPARIDRASLWLWQMGRVECSAGCNAKVAERQGFEPWIPCGIHAFQACALSHSAISPRSANLYESTTGTGPRGDGLRAHEREDRAARFEGETGSKAYGCWHLQIYRINQSLITDIMYSESNQAAECTLFLCQCPLALPLY